MALGNENDENDAKRDLIDLKAKDEAEDEKAAKTDLDDLKMKEEEERVV